MESSTPTYKSQSKGDGAGITELPVFYNANPILGHLLKILQVQVPAPESWAWAGNRRWPVEGCPYPGKSLLLRWELMVLASAWPSVCRRCNLGSKPAGGRLVLLTLPSNRSFNKI